MGRSGSKECSGLEKTDVGMPAQRGYPRYVLGRDLSSWAVLESRFRGVERKEGRCAELRQSRREVMVTRTEVMPGQFYRRKMT